MRQFVGAYAALIAVLSRGKPAPTIR